MDIEWYAVLSILMQYVIYTGARDTRLPLFGAGASFPAAVFQEWLSSFKVGLAL